MCDVPKDEREQRQTANAQNHTLAGRYHGLVEFRHATGKRVFLASLGNRTSRSAVSDYLLPFDGASPLALQRLHEPGFWR